MSKNIQIHFSLEGFTSIPRGIDYNKVEFNGGELGVKLIKSTPTQYKEKCEIFFEARVQSSKDVILLGLLKDAVSRVYINARYTLFMPYCPYGRQDRVCDFGESFSLKFFANYVNSLEFDRVITLDPHSDTIGAVFNNIEIQEQHDIVGRFGSLFEELYGSDIQLVSPDAGSNKKIGKLAKTCLKKDFIRADKVRDCTNGNILETKVYGAVSSRVLIVDDICDGGRTFEELAKELRKCGAKEIYLYVTHGIFSKGYEKLLDIGVDRIYHTDSFRKCESNDDRIIISKLNLKNYYI